MQGEMVGVLISLSILVPSAIAPYVMYDSLITDKEDVPSYTIRGIPSDVFDLVKNEAVFNDKVLSRLLKKRALVLNALETIDPSEHPEELQVSEIMLNDIEEETADRLLFNVTKLADKEKRKRAIKSEKSASAIRSSFQIDRSRAAKAING